AAAEQADILPEPVFEPEPLVVDPAETRPREVFHAVEPEPAPPAPAAPEPVMVREVVIPPPTVERLVTEVEYSWNDAPRNGDSEWHRPANPPLRSARPWPASPMIHRPDWW